MSDNIVHLYDRSQVEEEASDWIVRFDDDHDITQQDVEEFKRWVARSPMHKKIIAGYASMWSDMDLLSELMLATPKKARPEKDPARGVMSVPSRWEKWWSGLLVWGGSALTLAFCAVVALNLYSRFIDYPSSNGIYSTVTGQTRSITLSDDSIVWLNTASRVEVDYNSLQRRIVLLEGEAHFQVEKNAKQAFQVYAGKQMVKAIGTAFSVYKKDSSVSVTVTEGRVDLVTPRFLATNPQADAAADPINIEPSADSTTKDKDKMSDLSNFEVLGSLVAGQSIELPVDAKAQMAGMVTLQEREMDEALAWREGLLIFSGEPLFEVVEQVSRYSNIQIAISDPSVSAIRIGGQFKIGETDALFDVLENGFGLKVNRVDSDTVEILAHN